MTSSSAATVRRAAGARRSRRRRGRARLPRDGGDGARVVARDDADARPPARGSTAASRARPAAPARGRSTTATGSSPAGRRLARRHPSSARHRPASSGALECASTSVRRPVAASSRHRRERGSTPDRRRDAASRASTMSGAPSTQLPRRGRRRTARRSTCAADENGDRRATGRRRGSPRTLAEGAARVGVARLRRRPRTTRAPHPSRAQRGLVRRDDPASSKSSRVARPR